MNKFFPLTHQTKILMKIYRSAKLLTFCLVLPPPLPLPAVTLYRFPFLPSANMTRHSSVSMPDKITM